METNLLFQTHSYNRAERLEKSNHELVRSVNRSSIDSSDLHLRSSHVAWDTNQSTAVNSEYTLFPFLTLVNY